MPADVLCEAAVDVSGRVKVKNSIKSTCKKANKPIAKSSPTI